MAILAAVINWNGWHDTQCCLETMCRMSGPSFVLVVCDNGSTDGSFESMKRWAAERFPDSAQDETPLELGVSLVTIRLEAATEQVPFSALHFMRLPENLGYAGALNRCIEWGRRTHAPDRFWLLNNDIAPEPDALAQLVAAMEGDSRVGLCGSALMDWDRPGRYQAIGGHFNRLLATGLHLKERPAGVAATTNLYLGIDYPVGASLLASRAFVETVGLMDDGYFLYYEEMDWVQRGRASGFLAGVALQSRVRHKEGASTGSGRRSLLSEYYGIVNRLRYTRKFDPLLVPVVWASLFFVAGQRLLRWRWKNAAFVLRLMFAPRSIRRP